MSKTLNVKTGDTMPELRLQMHSPGAGVQSFDLQEWRGHPVVLFFYPEADTPGCTREAQGFNELLPQFAALGAEVVGASDDTVEAQARFAEKFALRMPLLADADGRVRELLGNPDGAEPAARITYVIDADGRVADIFGVPRIPAEEHPALALAAVEQLTQRP